MAPKSDTPDVVTEASLKKLKVTELREKLAEESLDTKGVKDELVKRLVEHFESKGASGTPASAAGEEPKAAAGATAEGEPVAASAPEARPSQAAPLSEEDKARARAERFGIPEKKQPAGKPPETKKGASIGGLGDVDAREEFERRKKRAERFGLPVPVDKIEEHEKKKARAERFGLPAPPPSALEVAAKLKAREERFGKQ